MDARTAFETAWLSVRRNGLQEDGPAAHREVESWVMDGCRASTEDQGWRRTLRAPGLVVTMWAHRKDPQWMEGDLGELIRLCNRFIPVYRQ